MTANKRVYVALQDSSPWIEILESLDFEAIPMTPGEVIDNINSLETSNIVVVDSSSPAWVLREAAEHHKFTVAVGSVPDGPVTALVFTEVDFRDLMTIVKPFSTALTPVDQEYARTLAGIMATYPVRRNLEH